MHSMFGSDYAIACCVSAMRLGKDMQVRAVHAALPTCGAAHFCLVLRCAAPLVPPPAARCSRVGVGRLPPAVPFFSSPQKQQQQRRECTPRHPRRRRRRLPQFFGARANLAKLLLYSLNSGVDEVTGKQVGPRRPPPALNADGSLNYEAVLASYDEYMGWLAEVYANTMNVIHYMHDKCVGAGGRAGRGDGLAWFWRGLRMAPLLLSLAAARAGKGAGVPGSDAASPLPARRTAVPPPPAAAGTTTSACRWHCTTPTCAASWPTAWLGFPWWRTRCRPSSTARSSPSMTTRASWSTSGACALPAALPTLPTALRICGGGGLPGGEGDSIDGEAAAPYAVCRMRCAWLGGAARGALTGIFPPFVAAQGGGRLAQVRQRRRPR